MLASDELRHRRRSLGPPGACHNWQQRPKHEAEAHFPPTRAWRWAVVLQLVESTIYTPFAPDITPSPSTPLSVPDELKANEVEALPRRLTPGATPSASQTGERPWIGALHAGEVPSHSAIYTSLESLPR